jgi:predicted metal-binding protein
MQETPLPETPLPVLVHVCVTCRREGDDPEAPRQGSRLRDCLAGLLSEGMTLQPVECLGNCKRSCTVALSAPGSWTYVFGDLTAESGPDVVTGAKLLAHSTDGLMPWRGRPEPFKRSMIARIPPIQPLKDAAE